MFTGSVVAQLEAWLEPDIYLYQKAVAQAAEQEAKHGRTFDERLAEYRSVGFGGICAAVHLGVPGRDCAKPAVKGAKRIALQAAARDG